MRPSILQFWSLWGSFVFCLLLTADLRGQQQETSPNENSASDLIMRLTRQGRWRKPPNQAPISPGCGGFGWGADEDRELARALAALGSAAVPDLESALGSLRKNGMKSEFWPGARWLLLVYATVRGPDSYPAMAPLSDNPLFIRTQSALGRSYVLPQIQNELDVAMAVAFNLTSYVAGSSERYSVLCRGQVPRDSLDRLIVAWRGGDKEALARQLGPNGRVALDAEHLEKIDPRGGAIGYRLEAPAFWSAPEETLEPPAVRPRDISKDPVNPEINVLFTDRLGKYCGSHRIRFLTPKGPPVPFFIDNSDLGDLFWKLRNCALQGKQ